MIPEPTFVTHDPETIVKECIARFEELTGEPLTPNQPEWLLLHVWAYRENLVRIALNEAARQNLLRFAQYPMIDHLGEMFSGTQRLPAQAAVTTLQFSIEAPLGAPVFIAAGTRARSKDSVAILGSDEDATIPAGQLSTTATATATTTGKHANGYLAGQISVMVDEVDGVSVANTTTTAGGAPQEDSLRYLERILLAPDAPSTAGSEAGYRYHALGASLAVEDVAVISDAPLNIRIVLLDDDGTVTQDIIDIVTAALSATKVRPGGDQLTVEASGVDDFTIEAELTIYKDADATSVEAAALAAAVDYVKSRRKLGRSALREQVRAKLAVDGVHSVNLIEPATDIIPAADSWARGAVTSVEVTAVSEETSE